MADGNSLKDIFGDSGSEDSDVPARAAPVGIKKSGSASAAAVAVAAGLGLSSSDDDSDAAPAPKKKLGRLQKGGAAKGKAPAGAGKGKATGKEKDSAKSKPRKRASVTRSASERGDAGPRKRSKAPAAASNAGGASTGTAAVAAGGGGGGGDSESEGDGVRTKADDDFLDNSGDDQDLLEDYGKVPEAKGGSKDIEDDEEEEDDDFDKPSGKAAKAAKGNPFDQVLKSMKRVKKQELSVAEREAIAADFLKRMDKSAQDDEEAVAQERPATSKLQMLKVVQTHLLKKDLQDTFLEYDLCTVVVRWLKPYPNGALPNISVREGLLKLLLTLPIDTQHLQRSGLGRVVMGLWKSDQETASNKALLAALIQKWNRPIFNKDINYQNLNRKLEDQELSIDRRRTAAAAASNRGGSSSGSGRGAESLALGDIAHADADAMLAIPSLKKKVAPEGRARVRVPHNPGLSFKFKPQSRVDVEEREDRPVQVPGRKAKMMKKMGK